MAWDQLAPKTITRLSRDLEITPQQAAGIVGQLGYESEGLQAINERQPVVPGSRGGFGWAQWTGPRRRQFESFAADRRLDVADPEANYQFLLHELSETPEGRVLEAIRAAPDAQTAGRIFTDRFLRPGVPAYDRRASWTDRAMEFLMPSAHASDTASQDGPWSRYQQQGQAHGGVDASQTGVQEGPWTRYAHPQGQPGQGGGRASARFSDDGDYAVVEMSHGGTPAADNASASGPLRNFGLGLHQGVTDVMAGIGQAEIHRTADIVNALFPDSDVARALRERATAADQEAAQREQDYQDATPGSIAAGVGRLTGGMLSGGPAGAAPLATLRGLGASTAARAGLGSSGQAAGGFLGTTVGSAMLGGGLGAALPVTEGDFQEGRQQQAIVGGAVGGLIPGASQAVGRTTLATGRTLRNLVEPFSEAGRGRIADRTLQRFSRDGPTAIDDVTHIPGSEPTLAQATGNPGLAGVERTLRNDPNLNSQFAARDRANAAARARAFEDISGDAASLAEARAARSATADDLYTRAAENFTDELPPALQPVLDELLKRPSIQQAQRVAQRWAAERGEALDPRGSFRGLHDMKRALDDAIGEQISKGKMAEASALRNTQAQLMEIMEALSPDYAQARATYAAMSRPIDAMEFLQGLNITDQRGNLTLHKVNNALRAAHRQRNQPGPTKGKSLTDDQMNVLTALRNDLLRADNLNLGRAVGSNTMQNFAADNLLTDALPLGNRLAQTALGGMVRRAGRIVYGNVDDDVRQQIVNRLLDLQLGRGALDLNRGLTAPFTQNPLVNRLAPYALPSLTGSGVFATTPR